MVIGLVTPDILNEICVVMSEEPRFSNVTSYVVSSYEQASDVPKLPRRSVHVGLLTL